jgi:carbonic anhydrase
VTATPLGQLPRAPRRRLAVVSCMDGRVNVENMLGLALGDAHVIRNAGGIVTDDVIRSLAISQRALGTVSIMLVQHSDCAMTRISDAAFTAAMVADGGQHPPWTVGAFSDVDASVRESLRRLTTSPFLSDVDNIRGFVYDLATGALREIA